MSTRFDRITFHRDVLGGRPCIRELRIPVSVVLAFVADGATADDVLADYPDLQREDVSQAIAFGAWLAAEQTGSLSA